MWPPETIRQTAGNCGLASRGVRFEKHRVNVAFEMIHRDQRLSERHRQNFAVGDADQQRADQARPVRYGDRIHIARA